jgi:hypothetical protein
MLGKCSLIELYF